MLTKRQNLLETIRGGNPDRFVNQYEFMQLLFMGNPIGGGGFPMPGGEPVKNAWGVYIHWPAGLPGPFPVHDEEHKLVKDITKWRDVVKGPEVVYPENAWKMGVEASGAVDRNEFFASTFVAPGIFEQLHYLMSIDDCLANLYLEPEYMKELIEYIVDWELAYAAEVTKYLKPDCILHHDDWGSHNSSFFSPEMFKEFFVPGYKKIYELYKNNGVEVIVHHSDSYAANLVPDMIEMGIDIFQGCVTTNNVPELVKNFGGKISFMGDLNNGVLDIANWTPELIMREVERACKTNGKLYFIPCLTAGGPGSTYPGVYEAVSEAIDKMSGEMFGFVRPPAE